MKFSSLMKQKPDRERPRAALRLEKLEDRTLPATITPLFPEVRVSTFQESHLNVSSRPDAGATEDGRSLVVWNRKRTTTDTDVLVRRFDNKGTPLAVNGTITVAGMLNVLE